MELAPIRVNVVSPGTIKTSSQWEGVPQEKRELAYDAYKKCLLERVGEAEEVAGSVIYLMNNRYTTGSTLFPDGGYILR
ncbi:hypothetical protein UB51_00755 [Paenibacillus sp. IHBB 10380]|nr:hypothetical protein UB51_00755 [Paenibacillus sp. IHBB 10380]